MSSRSWLIAGVALVAFAAGWTFLSLVRGIPPRSLVLFPPDSTGGPLALVEFATAVASAFVVLFLPGLAVVRLLTRLPRLAPVVAKSLRCEGLNELLLAAFLVSTGMWVGVAVILGGIPNDLGLRRNPTLLLALIGGAACIVASSRRAGHEPRRRVDLGRTALAGCVLIALLILPLRTYLSFNVLSDDEVEAANYALSLGTRSLPYWADDYSAEWGFLPNFMLSAYPLQALMHGLGPSEFSLRMLYFVSLFVALCGSSSLLQDQTKRRPRWSELVLLAGAAGLLSVVALFYSSWHPFLAGPAEPSGVDMFGFALFVGALAFYLRGREGWFLAFAWAQATALPNGIAYIGTWLTLVALLSHEDRRNAFRLGILYVGGVAAFALACRAAGGASLVAGSQFAFTDIAARYLTRISASGDMARFLVMMLLLSGGGILASVVLPWQRPARNLAIIGAFVALHTVVATIFYPLQHPHYHLPLMLLVCVLALSLINRLPVTIGRWASGLLAAGYVLGILLFMPRTPRLIDNARRLGSRTEVSCSQAELRTLYRDANGLVSMGSVPGPLTRLVHGIDRNQWLLYSTAFVADEKTLPDVLVLSASSDPPPGFQRVGGGESCQVAISARFNPDDFIPMHGYRNEQAWQFLAVRIWRDHFGS